MKIRALGGELMSPADTKRLQELETELDKLLPQGAPPLLPEDIKRTIAELCERRREMRNDSDDDSRGPMTLRPSLFSILLAHRRDRVARAARLAAGAMRDPPIRAAVLLAVRLQREHHARTGQGARSPIDSPIDYGTS